MHPLQEHLLTLIDEKNIGNLTLREIGKLIGEELPQKVKHHLTQLEAKGFITIDKRTETIKRISDKAKAGDLFVSLPIVGSANCGPAEIYADENIDGYLKISRNLVPYKKGLYVIKADGNSLNKATVKGEKNKNIESGDYVIVDSENISPRDGDYVVSIIDGMANIKKYRHDKANQRIVLVSESTKDYPPIFIHQDDDFSISGTVVEVVKKF
jgi:repressor LexA